MSYTYINENRIILPAQKIDVNLLLAEIKSNSTVLSFNNPYYNINWNVIKQYISESWINEFFDECFASLDLNKIKEWSNNLNNMGYRNSAKHLRSRIETEEKKFTKEDSSKVIQQLTIKAKERLSKQSTYPEKILSSVNLPSQTFSKIVLDLGNEYNVLQAIESEGNEEKMKKYILHSSIITLLEHWGKRSSKGDIISIDLTNPPSKNDIGKLLETPFLVLEIKDKKKTITLKKEDVLFQERGKLIEIFKDDSDLQESAKKLQTGKAKTVDINKLKTAMSNAILNKKDANAYATAGSEVSSSKIKLDNWQKDVIDYIQKGESVLVVGPTSGGKTFVSMAALDLLLRRSKGSISRVWLYGTVGDVSIEGGKDAERYGRTSPSGIKPSRRG